MGDCLLLHSLVTGAKDVTTIILQSISNRIARMEHVDSMVVLRKFIVGTLFDGVLCYGENIHIGGKSTTCFIIASSLLFSSTAQLESNRAFHGYPFWKCAK